MQAVLVFDWHTLVSFSLYYSTIFADFVTPTAFRQLPLFCFILLRHFNLDLSCVFVHRLVCVICVSVMSLLIIVANNVRVTVDNFSVAFH